MGLSRPPQYGGEQAVHDFFVYSDAFAFTALNQRIRRAINIQADADFVLVKVMSSSSDGNPGGAGVQADGGALLLITDEGSQRQLFDQAVGLSAITGTGQRPFILPWVHRFPRQGSIGLDFTNTGTATQAIRVVFAGFKVIPRSRL